MNSKRRFERHPESLKMTIKPDEGAVRTLTTSNVGDGGIFLLASRGKCLPVGAEITITPLSSADGTVAPSIRGRVVHVSDEGMGIVFLDPSFS